MRPGTLTAEAKCPEGERARPHAELTSSRPHHAPTATKMPSSLLPTTTKMPSSLLPTTTKMPSSPLPASTKLPSTLLPTATKMPSSPLPTPRRCRRRCCRPPRRCRRRRCRPPRSCRRRYCRPPLRCCRHCCRPPPPKRSAPKGNERGQAELAFSRAAIPHEPSSRNARPSPAPCCCGRSSNRGLSCPAIGTRTQ